MTALALPARRVATEQPTAGLAVAAGLALAILMQGLWIPVDADVSWLITLSERLLGGERLYVDLLEANPPASVWLYLPQVWLAQQLGLRPEPLVIALAMAAAVGSIAWTMALAARLLAAPHLQWLAAGLAFILLVLPGGLFAQREHYALMLALPGLATLAMLSERQEVRLRLSIAAGLAAGTVSVIKPPLALVFLLPAGWALARTGSWRPLVAPVLSAAAVLACYAAALLSLAPEYLQVLPMLQATYLPMRETATNLLLGPMLVLPATLCLIATTLRPPKTFLLPTILFQGSAGFALAGLTQGKNYLNHSYPGVALALLALALLLRVPGLERGTRRVAALGLLLLAGLHLRATVSVQPPPGLTEAISEAGRPGATVLILGTELATGHPAVRLAGARWVGSRPSLFTAAAARYVGLADPKVRRWYRADLDSFARDVSTRCPDLILVEDRSRNWLMRDAAIRSALNDYAPASRAGQIEVWRRR